MTDMRHDYPEYHDERQQQDDQQELHRRLVGILQDAWLRPLTLDEIKTLCIACGIDVRNVT